MAPPSRSAWERASLVYCNVPMVATLQLGSGHADSKTAVDLPLLCDPEEVAAAFDRLTPEERADPLAARAFVARYFGPSPDAGLRPVAPEDWPDESPLVAGLSREELCVWVQSLHDTWPQLCRQPAFPSGVSPARSSLLPRRCTLVVPGGRFRETYYWDSFWIVLGLLASGMRVTAAGVVGNLVDDVARYGMVPNGGRVYYLSRSQPPLLAYMVEAVLPQDAGEQRQAIEEALGGIGRALALVHQELEWWASERSAPVAGLCQYRSEVSAPRPESFREDVATALAAAERRPDGDVWRAIRGAAESGWDFSSRWARQSLRERQLPLVATLDTSSVVPVDLNAFLAGAGLALARSCRRAGQLGALPATEAEERAVTLEASAQGRAVAMRHALWDESQGSFADWDMQCSSFSSVVALSSYAAPFFTGVIGPGGDEEKSAVESLQRSGLLRRGGVAATTRTTGEQWDAPNVWPPLQHMLVVGLDAPGRLPATRALGRRLARSWLASAHAAWRQSGHMFEKYSADVPGHGGGGGEYEPQVGFGWTNGAVLDLIRRYGDQALPADDEAFADERMEPAGH